MTRAASAFMMWLYLVLLLKANIYEVCGLGVAWGRQTSQILLPSAVVDMVLANGVKKVKFFSNNPGVVNAFMHSDVSVIVSCPNGEQKLIDTKEKAIAWVKENVTNTYHNGVKITHVCIGHEPYLKANATSYIPDENGETTYVAVILQTFKDIVGAIQEEEKKHGFNIKASIPLSTEILKPDTKMPSEGDFRDEMKENMTQILQTLNGSGAPFMINMYPHYHLREKGYPLEFAFFDEEAHKNFTIQDGENVYTNVFDATLDTFVSAIRKNGFPNMEIIVQVGWPTDGDLHANMSIAEKFYRGLLNKLSNNEGTPLYKRPLDVYINGLVDENRRSERPRGYADRHYGIYYYDGVTKYESNFNPLGIKKHLERVQGVSQMPRRWCVINDKPFTNETYEKLLNQTCKKADCSCLMYGGSCNGVLDRKGNLSYAFNMYFQSQSQNILGKACSFEGYGTVVDEDPTISTCEFPLQILSTIFVGGATEMAATLAVTGGNPNIGSDQIVIFVTFLSLIFQLLYFT